MSDGASKDELRAAIDNLSEDRARTLLSWMRVTRRGQEALAHVDASADGGNAPGIGDKSVGPLGDMLGIVSEVREQGRCLMRLEIDEAWLNPNGVLHGGVIYTMVDYSMGGAVQPHLPEGAHCATIEIKINYLSSVREGTLRVESNVVKQGRSIAFVDSKVTDDKGRVVVTASGSMFLFSAPAGPAK